MSEETSPQHAKPDGPDEAGQSGQGATATPQAVYEETMARFADMYEEWHRALYAMRDS